MRPAHLRRPQCLALRTGGPAARRLDGGTMLIDCDVCEMRDIACRDCVVTALLGGPGHQSEIGEAERHALNVLADARLVSPLRLRVPVTRAS